MAPTLQDLRRIFFGADEDGTVSDAEYEFLQEAADQGISALDLLAIPLIGLPATQVSVDSAPLAFSNGDDVQEVLGELDTAIVSASSGGLAAVATADSAEIDFSGNGIVGTPLSGTLKDGISANRLVEGDATHKLLTQVERDKLTGISPGATANSSDATLLARANHTGTQSADTVVDGAANKAYTAAEKTKLGTVAAGATQNSPDATLLARANHTGTQSADSIVASATKDVMLLTERTKLTGIAVGATQNSPDATLLARANHTGSQAISTVTGLQTALDLKEPFLHTVDSKVASYSLVLADAAKKVIEISNAAANTLTVPTNATQAFAIGTEILIIQMGAGATTITPAGGVTLRSLQGNLVLAGQYGWAKLIKRATNEWLVDIHGVVPGPRELARAATVTAQTGIGGTPVDLNNLSITFTVGIYPVDVELELPWISATTSSANGLIDIYDTPGAAVKRYGLFGLDSVTDLAMARTVERITAPGTYTRKGRIAKSTGTGTINVSAAGTEAVTGGFIRAIEVAT